MKKGFSKNRHRSEYAYKRRTQRTHNSHYARNPHSHECKKKLQLAEKSFKWNCIATIIQVLDFLIDKLPRIIRYLILLLGMGA